MAVRGEERGWGAIRTRSPTHLPLAVSLTTHWPKVQLNARLQVAKGNCGSPHIAGDVGVFAGRIEFVRRQRVVLVSVNVLVFVDVRGGGVKFRSNVPGVLRVK
jgi:hypothetical protein